MGDPHIRWEKNYKQAQRKRHMWFTSLFIHLFHYRRITTIIALRRVPNDNKSATYWLYKRDYAVMKCHSSIFSSHGKSNPNCSTRNSKIIIGVHLWTRFYLLYNLIRSNPCWLSSFKPQLNRWMVDTIWLWLCVITAWCPLKNVSETEIPSSRTADQCRYFNRQNAVSMERIICNIYCIQLKLYSR